MEQSSNGMGEGRTGRIGGSSQNRTLFIARKHSSWSMVQKNTHQHRVSSHGTNGTLMRQIFRRLENYTSAMTRSDRSTRESVIPDGPDELHRWQISGPFQQGGSKLSSLLQEEFARVPVSSSSDVDSAVLAARRAQSGWGS